MTSQRAFTLLEVVVTMVLAAILATMGVVAYKQVAGGVRDKGAQAVVTSVVAAERTHEQTRGSFTDDPGTLQRIEGAYRYVGAASEPRPGEVSVGLLEGPADGEVLAVATPSKSGKCFGSVLQESNGTVTTKNWVFDTDQRPCTAQVVSSNVGSDW